ncbi:DNA-binding protein [Serinicoccus sp. CNJ-927]|uniref:helix-turn-helix transcriptional regulator n=1 Tax=Serinicoccus TaxID=265976 RepID=UPI0003B7AEA0|nr:MULTISPECIES: helix-turn-helix domain-containing protein [Serinicoccus]OLT15250.1 DNA-binding protein [Serinicoccus sp. CUA-874]OLT39196.1 DNA-binding protein [Serinicoccus sp. CNJ-927]
MPGPRFLTLPDVADTLNVSLSQVKALVRSGQLAGIKLGGRGVWRVESTELEAYIQRMYAETRESLHQGEEPR